MKRTPTVLYCHCAQAQVTPEETRRRALEAIAAGDAAYEAVADLCELAARRDPLLRRFAKGPAPRIVACHPRAVRALFAAADAPLPAHAVIYNLRTTPPDSLPWKAGHGRGKAKARRAAARQSQLDTTAGPAFVKTSEGKQASRATRVPARPPATDATGCAGRVPQRKAGSWVPWFPVIDYDRCQGCRQCLQFCLFGVYAEDGGKVRVAQPDRCKTGCPACARICPKAAIIFPKYADGFISGDDSPPAEADRPAQPIDFSSLAGMDLKEAMRRRAAILRARLPAGGQARQERTDG